MEPKRFTSRRPPADFTIDEDTFTAVGTVPAELMKTLMAEAEKLGAATDFASRYEGIKTIVEGVLLPESLARFRTRLADLDNPIDMEALGDVSTWLLTEVYSKRPTPSPSPSGTSESNGGMPSTDGPPPAESTPAALTGTAT